MVFVIEGLSDFMYNEEIGKYEGYIYQIYNPFNMKSYIGQTSIDIHRRMIQHKTKAKNHPSSSIYLYSDVRDFGWNAFSVYMIEKLECDSKEDLRVLLNNKEIFYIAQHNSLYPNGYNISKGGDVLPNTFEECRVYKFDLDGNLIASYDSIAEAARINNVSQADISNCCNGKKVVTVGGFYWSKEPALSIGDINRQKTRVVVYNLDCRLIKVFDSMKDGAEEMYGDKNFSYHISNSINSGRASCGYVWKRYDDVVDSCGDIMDVLPDDMIYRVNHKKHSHPDMSKGVVKYSLQDEMIECFKSMTVASEITGINRSCISACVNGKQKTAGGFIWKLQDMG